LISATRPEIATGVGEPSHRDPIETSWF